MVPKTDDGRVLFAIPWLGKTVIGTTDVPVDAPTPGAAARRRRGRLHPGARRPLPRPRPDARRRPRRLGRAAPADLGPRRRRHGRAVARARRERVGLGPRHGHRRQVDDVPRDGRGRRRPRRRDRRASTSAQRHGRPAPARLAARRARTTRPTRSPPTAPTPPRRPRDRHEDPASRRPVHPRLPTVTGAEIVWAAREEQARTAVDALARRTRGLFLDADASAEAADAVAALVAAETGRDAAWAAEQVRAVREVAAGEAV